MAHYSTLAVAVASALCLHTILAYPTSVERVSGDNNNLQLRNSPSRDLDRFIDACNDDVNECILPSGVVLAKRMSLDRLNGGHTMAAKRMSLDRLNGGHTMAAKRMSLDRLNGGHIMAAKRMSLDRLNGGHIMAAKRSSLDRLNGGHTLRSGSLHDRSDSVAPALTGWTETGSDFDRDYFYSNDDGGDCLDCGPSVKWSSF